MPKTYNELYIALSRQLKEAGVEAAGLEARLLLSAVCGKSKETLLRDLRLYAAPETETALEKLAERRLAGEPAAYVTGRWEFYGLELIVTPDVLIPRSDTETAVDAALELLRGQSAPRILDLCTGSGCIGIALAACIPGAKVVLADLSLKALEIAQRNVRLHALTDRVQCRKADALRPPEAQLGTFDFIISNPPYVTDAEMEDLPESVRCYEPETALRGGADGLDFYRAILRNWKPLLRRGGAIVFEVGDTQSEAVEKLMRFADLREISAREDTAGIRRAVLGKV